MNHPNKKIVAYYPHPLLPFIQIGRSQQHFAKRYWNPPWWLCGMVLPPRHLGAAHGVMLQIPTDGLLHPPPYQRTPCKQENARQMRKICLTRNWGGRYYGFLSLNMQSTRMFQQSTPSQGSIGTWPASSMVFPSNASSLPKRPGVLTRLSKDPDAGEGPQVYEGRVRKSCSPFGMVKTKTWIETLYLTEYSEFQSSTCFAKISVVPTKIW